LILRKGKGSKREGIKGRRGGGEEQGRGGGGGGGGEKEQGSKMTRRSEH